MNGLLTVSLLTISILVLIMASILIKRRSLQRLEGMAAERGNQGGNELEDCLSAGAPCWIVTEAIQDLNELLKDSGFKTMDFPWRLNDKLVRDFEMDHEDLEDMIEAFLKRHEIPMESLTHTISIEEATVGDLVEFYGLSYGAKIESERSMVLNS